ncbi:DUF881 domain-containing protein [Clostridium sp. JN-9]|uniref:DUF881 domain-containing protein n=1 Tax=Clostridium sp. JN-9 TaxID=2507159 RepID=UPI000FFDFE93|nr:DUF881 domain-containing protein [Clostridium sp. JN-9]QAT40012.1 DUF881 domain-containing protein [Clostridium sp. JN-9]
MRKSSQHLSVALVCGILGFMLTYQFKILLKQDKIAANPNNSTDITVEIEQYKKEKDQLQTKVNDLQTKLNNYESAAAGSSETSKNLLKELDESRLLTGAVDVQGQGVIIYLTPNNTLFGTNNNDRLGAQDLVYLVNELKFAGAEAISINDIRIVNSTGIRDAGNYILANDERISPSSRITIKAIGNQKLLYSALDFQEVFKDIKLLCDVKYEKSDSIKILKYNKTYKFEYAKPVQ